MEIFSFIIGIAKNGNTYITLAVIALTGIFLFVNKHMIGTETKSKLDDFRVDFSKFQTLTHDALNNRTCRHHEVSNLEIKSIREGLKDCVEQLGEVSIESKTKDLEFEDSLKDIATSISSLHVAVESISKDLKSHTLVLSMYENHQMFLKEVRDTFSKSLDILRDNHEESQKASAYLLFVAEQVVEVCKYIKAQGILNLDSQTLDGKLATAIHECKKQMKMFYDEDIVEPYFKSSIPVWNFKRKLTELIKSREKTNNIERSFRTMVIAFCEKLCNNFFIEVYINGGKNGTK